MPSVSVVMPVHNGMPYLPQAVESILHQTFRDFELIVINDASTDGTAEFLNSIEDPRLVLIDNPVNLGVTGALKAGMLKVKGQYVARMDSDDISFPERLQVQFDFMTANPDVGLLGCSPILINKNNEVISPGRSELSDIEIRWKLLFKNPFYHSSVMFRNSVLKEHHLDYELKHGEDYDLWTRILRHTSGFIMGNPLVKYRINEESWTYSKSDEQAQAGRAIAIGEIGKIVGDCDTNLIWFLEWIKKGNKRTPSVNRRHIRLYLKLLREFIEIHFRKATVVFIADKLKFAKRRGGISFLLYKEALPVMRSFIKRKFRQSD